MDTNKTSTDVVLEFLHTHPVAHLATVDANGQPTGATVFYKVDDSLNFYFITKSDTQKYKNMQVNKHVALTISDDQVLRTVQVRGVAELLDSASLDLTRAIGELEDLHFRDDPQWKAPIARLQKGEFRFVKVVPQWIRGTNFKNWDNLIDFQQVELQGAK